MKGFINTEYYVECRSHEEIIEFCKICDEAGLRMRSGQNPSQYAHVYGDYATFAHNYKGKGDGISSWSQFPSDSDHKKPHVLFADFLKNNQANDEYDATGILDLL